MLADKLVLIAIGAILAGIILLVIASFLAVKERANAEIGFGGFIGPIPFGFFSSRRAFWLWLVLAILAAAFLIIWLLSRRP